MSYKNLPRFDSSVGYKEKRKNEAGASNKKEKTIMIERGNKEGNGAERAYEADKAYGQGGQRVPLEPKPFLPKKGNYRGLLVYQKAECLYDISFYFAHHYFVERKDRTIDQVIQAARSGKQNIAEGCAAASTSSETELKLLGVARASMKEVLEDYIDYLRTRHLEQWSLEDPRTKQIQEYSKKHNRPEDYTTDIDKRSPEALCNIAITLIHQYDNLMGKLIDRLQKDFVEEGGIRERMTAARVGYRNEQKTRIVELEAENATLKAKIVELEKKLKGAMGPMGLIGLIGLIGLMGLMGCSSGDAEEQVTKEVAEKAITISARQATEEAVTRSGETGLENIHTIFVVWAYKNMTETTGNYDGLQQVIPGYTVKWVTNTANTTTSNTHDWEYVNQQSSGQEEQTIKYWDWSAKAYRFFGVAGTYGTHGATGANTAYEIALAVDASDENNIQAPYYSKLWFSTGNEDGKAYGQAVRLEFLQPLSRVRFMFRFPDDNSVTRSDLTSISFHPTSWGDPENPYKKIHRKGTFTVSYPLKGTDTKEQWTVSDLYATAALADFTEDYRENNEIWHYVLPAKSSDQGSYTLNVKVSGEDKDAVVPAEYMGWEPGYQYTYIFKIIDGGGVVLEGVETGFKSWVIAGEKDHEVYNW